MRKNCLLIVLFLTVMIVAKAQTFIQYTTTTDGAAWRQSRINHDGAAGQEIP